MFDPTTPADNSEAPSVAVVTPEAAPAAAVTPEAPAAPETEASGLSEIQAPKLADDVEATPVVPEPAFSKGDVVRYRYTDPRGAQELVGQVLDVLEGTEEGPERLIVAWFNGVSGPLHSDDVETV